MQSKQVKQKNSEIHQKEKKQLDVRLTFKKNISDDEELAIWSQIFNIVFNDDSLKEK